MPWVWSTKEIGREGIDGDPRTFDEVERTAVLHELDAILNSPVFQPSKRCQQFLVLRSPPPPGGKPRAAQGTHDRGGPLSAPRRIRNRRRPCSSRTGGRSSQKTGPVLPDGPQQLAGPHRASRRHIHSGVQVGTPRTATGRSSSASVWIGSSRDNPTNRKRPGIRRSRIATVARNKDFNREAQAAFLGFVGSRPRRCWPVSR